MGTKRSAGIHNCEVLLVISVDGCSRQLGCPLTKPSKIIYERDKGCLTARYTGLMGKMKPVQITGAHVATSKFSSPLGPVSGEVKVQQPGWPHPGPAHSVTRPGWVWAPTCILAHLPQQVAGPYPFSTQTASWRPALNGKDPQDLGNLCPPHQLEQTP